jgi:uncharacterized damage-inducible protein DinB
MDNHALGQMLEAWRTNHRLHLFLIDRIPDEGMRCTLSTRGGRNVVRQFAHLHNVRIWHLEKRAKALAEGLETFDTYDEPGKEELKARLTASAERLETFFEQSAAGAPGVRTFKKGALVHLAYFIAHESHHRGNILLTLKQCGHNLDNATKYAIWDWDRR